MHVIFGNYGDDTVALIQWMSQQALTDVYVVDIDTGWAAPSWGERVAQCQAWVHSLGFTALTLQPEADFTTLMQVRGQFPTTQFQWCAGFLKGLALLDWLDQPEVDPSAEAIIVLPHRRLVSSRQAQLPEWLDESEEYDERRVWHPLYQHNDQQRSTLIAQSGMPALGHRSLECGSCVNSDVADVLHMDQNVIERTAALEAQLQGRLFDEAVYQGEPDLIQAVAKLRQSQGRVNVRRDLFDMGCGSPYGCGL